MPGRLAAALLAVTVGLTVAVGTASAGVLPDGLVVHAAGRAPILGGRADTAVQQALDEVFRRAVLHGLRTIFPDRQTSQDLELWQDTVLARAANFVGAWRILAQEERGGFMNLEAEVEIWRSKLEGAVTAPIGQSGVSPVRLVVFADPYPLNDRSADEEVDAGWYAVADLEAEFARRGAVILSTINRAPWIGADWRDTAENRVALAASEGRRLEADAFLVVHVLGRGKGVSLSVKLYGSYSEALLGETRSEITLPGEGPLAEVFNPASRHAAAALAPRLGAARIDRVRDTDP